MTLHMQFLLSFFHIFSKIIISQGIKLRKKYNYSSDSIDKTISFTLNSTYFVSMPLTMEHT